ncbi:hypothetical protein [Paraclostridium tenue]|uniref:DNA-binding protein n=1 Tax=Paraclostridium tenue TaxID=1737 RepID=A0ABN1MBB4_9FIRM
MNKEEFNKLNFLDKVNYINSRLKKGETVIRIREDIGIGEKAFQKEMKINGYKYNSKEKQYISTEEKKPTIVVDPTTIVGYKNTTVVPKQQLEILGYLESNFEILQEFIEKYKSTTKSTTETTTNYISINLIDDKHLNPKPKSIRINEFVYQEWKDFCETKRYSKQDLISMALKEYMEKYK